MDNDSARPPAVLDTGRLSTEDLVDRVSWSVKLKADAVSTDEREGGRRALLNYGHTLGHALETLGDHELLHGEAVAIGIAYAGEVAFEMGRIDEARVAYHREVLAGYDLPMAPPGSPAFGDIEPLLSRDKKALDGVTLILDGPKGCEVVANVEANVLAASYERLVA